jgi:hypothetical protein
MHYDLAGSAAMLKVASAVEERVHSIRENATLTEQWTQGRLAVLEDAAKRYIANGVAYAPNSVVQSLEYLHAGTAREFFKSIADDLARPFVFAENLGHGIVLTIPKNKAMENIVAPLLIINPPAAEFETRNDRYRLSSSSPIIRDESAARWKFLFRYTEGDAQFDSFLEMCRTSPVARVILKIPK